jgi:hypothetical protein
MMLAIFMEATSIIYLTYSTYNKWYLVHSMHLSSWEPVQIDRTRSSLSSFVHGVECLFRES